MGEKIENRNDEEAFVIEPVLGINSLEEEAGAKDELKLRNTMNVIHHSRNTRMAEPKDSNDKHLTIHINMQRD